MTTKAEDGYQFAVACAIAFAGEHSTVEFYRGLALGLYLWADAVPAERWKADRARIMEAQRCAMTKTMEGV